MIKYTQQSFHKNYKFMFTSIYNRILNYCNSVYKSPSSKTVKKMKEESARWFIDLLQQRYSTGTSDSPCIHTGNKCVIIMVDHLQSGIGRQATGNIVYLLLMQGKTHRLQNQLDLSVRIDRILAPQ